MTRVFECNICYENKRSIVKCFHKCSAIVCRCCFKKLIQLNEVNEISYCCPVCRELSIRHKNKKFTLYCNKAPDVLKRIVGLFENDIKLEKERQVGESWTNFQAQIMDHDTDDDVEPFEPSSNPTINQLFRMIDEDQMPLHLQDLFSHRRLLSRSNSL
jgi:hypothetical protein